MFAKINGIDLFFDVVGSALSVEETSLEPKPTLIVLHGGPGGDHSLFRPWFDGMQDVAQIIYFDHRGTGRSGHADLSTYTLEQMADDIEGLRLYLGIAAPVVLGASFGGMVALNYAIRHPDSLSKLILVDTAPSNDYYETSMKKMAEMASAEQLEMLTARFTGSSTEEQYARWAEVVDPLYYHKVPPLADRQAINLRVKGGAAVAEQVMRYELPTYDVRPQLAAITVPTLVAVGRHDWVTTPEQADEIVQGIPHANLHVFEDSGHNPLVEDTEEFIATISGFIRS